MADVRLRRWRLEDAAAVAVMAEDPWLSPWSTLVDGVEQWIRREMAEARGPTRAICLADDDRVLGRVALRPPELASEAVRCEAVRASDQPAGELSYWLLPHARGRGLARAAVRLMIDSVAPALELRSMVLDIEDGNLPSIRLAERLGAERRSPTRMHPDRFGAQHTMVVYVLPLA
jgi:[ribosomal protein S5]-alanine N-acetyltransferase